MVHVIRLLINQYMYRALPSYTSLYNSVASISHGAKTHVCTITFYLFRTLHYSTMKEVDKDGCLYIVHCVVTNTLITFWVHHAHSVFFEHSKNAHYVPSL